MITNLLTAAAFAASPGNVCASTLDAVTTKVETNYAGYVMAVRDDAHRAADYADAKAGFAAEAALVGDEDVLGCTRVLRRYVKWFDDPHLFLNPVPELDEAAAAAMREKAPRVDASADFLRLTGENATDRGPLVGVWASADFDVAVIPNADGTFSAVVVESRSDDWAVGDVAATFTTRGGVDADRYDYEAVRFRGADRAPIMADAAVQTKVMLHMPPLTWGRVAPAMDSTLGDFDPTSPRSPRFARLSDKAVWVGIPSFSPEHGEAIARIAADHGDEIRAAELLIVDLRGNEGGSSGLIAPLEPFFFGASDSTDAPELIGGGTPLMLSSPDTIGFYERLLEQIPEGEDHDIFADFIERMRGAPGELTPLLTREDHIAEYNKPRVVENVSDTPPNVAFISDRYVVSAGEAVLLRARKQDRVTVFGENTGGSIDYQQVYMVSVGDGALRHYLGYPLMAAHAALPAEGHNAAGVPVDVVLEGPDEGWIDQILAHYGLEAAGAR